MDRKRDRLTGLNNVEYSIVSRKEMEIEGAPVTILNINLVCHMEKTPWCVHSEE